jgi:oligopeptide transport system substrate-binding protein
VITGPVPVLYFLGFNVQQDPFDDGEVRQAISMAIDRSRIVAEVLEGNIDIARAAVPPTVPGGRARTCAACQHDPDAARDVFEERGIDQITLWFNRDGGHEPIAQRIREDLGAVGVRVVWRTEEFADYLQALERGEANLYRFGWAPDYPTLDESLYPLFHSQSVPQNGGHNYGRYADAEVDDLLTRRGPRWIRASGRACTEPRRTASWMSRRSCRS